MVGASATAAAAAIYSVGTAFETSMAKVSTIADTASVSLNSLSSGIVELSNETGMAATELSNAMYEAISANVDTADALSFTEQAVKLARGGFTDAASAVDVMTTVLNAYGKAATESAHVSDVLIQVQNKGKTTVNELASNMGRVIPTASAYNVTLENLGAAYALMTSNGIATAETTTYLNSMLNELGKSGTDASDALKELTGKSFKQLMEDGMSLGEVLAILEDGAEASGLSIADMFGSAEAGKAALTLLSNGAEGFNDSLADMRESTGLTESAFETMSDTAENSAEVIKNKFKNLGIEIYNQNSDSLDRILSAINDLADGFIEFAKNAASKAADALTWIIDNADALTVALKMAVSALVIFKTTTLALTAIEKARKAIEKAREAVESYVKNLEKGKKSAVELAAGMSPLSLVIGVFTGKVKLATVKQLAFNAAKQAATGLWGLLAAGIAAAVTALKNWVDNNDKAVKAAKAIKEEVKALKQEYEQATEAAEDNANADKAKLVESDKLISRLNELDREMKSGTLTTDEYTAASNELRTVVNRLNEIMPELKIGIDEETGALDTQISKVNELYNSYKDLYLLKTNATYYGEKSEAAAKRLSDAENALKEAKATWDEYTKDGAWHVALFGNTYKTSTLSSAYTDAQKEYEAAKAEYDKIFDEWKKAETELTTGTAEIEEKIKQNAISAGLSTDAARAEKFLNTTGQTIVKNAEETVEEVKQAYEDQLKALDRSHKLGEISDAQYYKKLAKLRDEYLDESSDEWLDLTVEINKYNKQAAEDAKKLSEEQVEALFDDLESQYKLGEISEAEYYAALAKLRDEYLDETSDKWLETTLAINEYNEKIAAETINSYQSAIDDIQKKQQSFASKLLGTYDLIEKTTKTYQFGNLPEVTVEYTELADLNQQTADMQAYADALEAVKNRGNLPSGFFSELRDLSMDEGLEYANALLRLSDKDFAEYVKAWQERKDVADEISKEMYSDEASALASALEEEFGQLPEDFFDLGEDSAEKYGEGFMNSLPALMESIKAQITSGLSSIMASALTSSLATAARAGTTYNNTYNVQPSAGESTQAQLLAISNTQNLNEQRGV